MEKKKYEMPQVEVRKLKLDLEMPMATSVGVTKTESFSNTEMDNLSNRNNVWEDLW